MITKIAFDGEPALAFGGASFGQAGQYEKLTGRAFGELDSARHLRAHAQELDGAAAQSRSLAAKYRRLAGSHRRSPGC